MFENFRGQFLGAPSFDYMYEFAFDNPHVAAGLYRPLLHSFMCDCHALRRPRGATFALGPPSSHNANPDAGTNGFADHSAYDELSPLATGAPLAMHTGAMIRVGGNGDATPDNSDEEP